MSNTQQLLVESVPIASILLFWTGLSWIGINPTVARGFRIVGVVMATVYVVARGASLTQLQNEIELSPYLSELLRENIRVALPVSLWFLLAVVVTVVESNWSQFGLPGFGTSPAQSLVFVSTATGVGIATLYAVAAVVPEITGDGTSGSPAGSTSLSSDD